MFTEYGSSDDESSNEATKWEGSDKMALADAVIHKMTTVSKQAQANKISRNTMKMWVKRLKQQHRLYTNGGRPRYLDSISDESIRRELDENPHMETQDLKDLINLEYRLSHQRSHPMSIASDFDDFLGLKLQSKTMRNYVIRFRSQCRAQGGEESG